MKKIGLSPLSSDLNSFVNRFAQCFVDGHYNVQSFSTHKIVTTRYDCVILHWPNDFFVSKSFFSTCVALAKLAIFNMARILFGIQFIWVAHNLAPHETDSASPFIRSLFFKTLSGIIFLSHTSKELVHKTYPQTATLPSLVTRHGHYRDLMQAPVTPRPLSTTQAVNMVCFGQIRPYKNIETLIESAANVKNLNVLILGMAQSKMLAAHLKAMTEKTRNIQIDIREDVLPDTDLERAIDSSDAIILPYQAVLNSGSVFLALSRNRPVLAPRMGSLPELQDNVGQDWLTLYDGALSPKMIEDFLDKIRLRCGGDSPDLSAYEWNAIGSELCAFVHTLIHSD